jgi:hypothetical protein
MIPKIDKIDAFFIVVGTLLVLSILSYPGITLSGIFLGLASVIGGGGAFWALIKSE